MAFSEPVLVHAFVDEVDGLDEEGAGTDSGIEDLDEGVVVGDALGNGELAKFGVGLGAVFTGR